jgi:hypothetical protein
MTQFLQAEDLASLEVDKKIGKGQFSEVYRVKNKAGECLALKKIQV